MIAAATQPASSVCRSVSLRLSPSHVTFSFHLTSDDVGVFLVTLQLGELVDTLRPQFVELLLIRRFVVPTYKACCKRTVGP